MLEKRAFTQEQKQEAEANRFAIDLLAPAYRLKPYLACAPDMRSAQSLHRELDISLEAAVRRYVELHDEPLAAVMSKDRVVRYIARNDEFPQLRLRRDETIAPATEAHRIIAAGKTGVTPIEESPAAAWLLDPTIGLSEQTRLGKNGWATTLLWVASPAQNGEGNGVDELGNLRF